MTTLDRLVARVTAQLGEPYGDLVLRLALKVADEKRDAPRERVALSAASAHRIAHAEVLLGIRRETSDAVAVMHGWSLLAHSRALRARAKLVIDADRPGSA